VFVVGLFWVCPLGFFGSSLFFCGLVFCVLCVWFVFWFCFVCGGVGLLFCCFFGVFWCSWGWCGLGGCGVGGVVVWLFCFLGG